MVNLISQVEIDVKFLYNKNIYNTIDIVNIKGISAMVKGRNNEHKMETIPFYNLCAIRYNL